LAFPTISNLKQNPFFNTASKQGVVKESVFGFKLASQGSELFLGGTNNKLFSGNLEFHKVDPSAGFWQVPGATVKVNGKASATSFETVIDSGTT
jgi:cathepsin D